MSDRNYYLSEVVDRETIYRKARENADRGDFVVVHYHPYHDATGEIPACNEVCEWITTTSAKANTTAQEK